MRHRHHVRAALAALALCAASTVASAADPAFPDMRGTWRVETNAVVTGAGGHYPADPGSSAVPAEPRLSRLDATVRITGQEGARFWGAISSPAQTEGYIASFTGEGGRFVVVDSDGFASGEVLAPGRGRICYQHVAPDLHVVSCGTMTRE